MSVAKYNLTWCWEPIPVRCHLSCDFSLDESMVFWGASGPLELMLTLWLRVCVSDFTLGWQLFGCISDEKTYRKQQQGFPSQKGLPDYLFLGFQPALAGCWVLFYQVTITHWYHLKPMMPFSISSLLQEGKVEMRSSSCLWFRNEFCPAPPQQLLRALSSSERLKQQEDG